MTNFKNKIEFFNKNYRKNLKTTILILVKIFDIDDLWDKAFKQKR